MNWIENIEKIVGKEIVFTDPKLRSNDSAD